MRASGGCGDEAGASGRQALANAIFPVERDLNGFARGYIVKIDHFDGSGKEFGIVREGHYGVETGIVRRPMIGKRTNAPLGEDSLFAAVGNVVENCDRR